MRNTARYLAYSLGSVLATGSWWNRSCPWCRRRTLRGKNCSRLRSWTVDCWPLRCGILWSPFLLRSAAGAIRLILAGRCTSRGSETVVGATSRFLRGCALALKQVGTASNADGSSSLAGRHVAGAYPGSKQISDMRLRLRDLRCDLAPCLPCPPLHANDISRIRPVYVFR